MLQSVSVLLVDRRLKLGVEAVLSAEHFLLYPCCECSFGKRLAVERVSEPWEAQVGVWMALFLLTSETFQDYLP